MRLIKPSDAAPASRGPRLPAAKPQWLREKIEDQGRWAELTCGHRLNISLRGVTVITVFGTKNVNVLCEPCGDIRPVKRFMSARAYLGIKKTAVSDQPQF